MKQNVRCYATVAAILAGSSIARGADIQAAGEGELTASPLADTIRAIIRQNPPSPQVTSAGVSAGEGSIVTLAQLDPGVATPAAEEDAQAAESQPLDEIVVTGLKFRYDEATTAMKLPLSVKDTPQTIKAVTEDVIDFSGIRKFEDVYKIDASGGTSHALDDFARNYYRGFRQESDNAIKVDGFRLTGAVNLDLAPFERFEIVKGATSTLYGQNSVAGTLNAISKMPRSTFGGELTGWAGSDDYYRTEVDLYGPVTDDGALAFRVIGAYTDRQSFLDLAKRQVRLIAPTLRYDVSSDTSVTARVIYQDNDSRHHFGYGLQITDDGLQIPDVPRSTYGGMEWNKVKRDVLFVLTTLEHSFANDWTLRGSMQYNEVKGTLTEFIPVGLDAAGFALIDATYARNDEDDVYAGEVTLFGDVELFGRNHTLFAGLDHSSQKFEHLSATDFLSFGFNIFDPDPTLIPPRLSLTDSPFFFGQRDRNKESGVTLQALLRPTDALTVILGTRYTHNDLNTRTREGEMALVNDFTALPFSEADTIDSDEVTVQTGVTWAITEEVNVYASYGETFEPQFGFVASGDVIDPERGTAYEMGLKGDFAQRLSYSLALFDMERTNIAQSDFLNPGFLIPLGTQRSRGVELDFQGEIIEGWDVYGSVAVLDAEFTEGQFEGMQPVNAPRFGLSLFTSYEFSGGALEGLGIGGGIVHKHGRETFDDDRFGIFGFNPVFDFGDFTELDLRAYYTLDNWRFQLSGTNLTDEKYYSPTFNHFAFAIHANPARAVLFDVSYAF